MGRSKQDVLMCRVLQAAHDARKYGVDVFFYYCPHIDSVELSMHVNGWEVNHDADVHLDWYENKTYGDRLEQMLEVINAAIESKKAKAESGDEQ